MIVGIESLFIMLQHWPFSGGKWKRKLSSPRPGVIITGLVDYCVKHMHNVTLSHLRSKERAVLQISCTTPHSA